MNDEPSFLDDVDLAAAIACGLQTDARVAITVNVAAGIVTLEGEVEHAHEREAAELVARSFDGVAGVVNNITLIQPRPQSA